MQEEGWRVTTEWMHKWERTVQENKDLKRELDNARHCIKRLRAYLAAERENDRLKLEQKQKQLDHLINVIAKQDDICRTYIIELDKAETYHGKPLIP